MAFFGLFGCNSDKNPNKIVNQTIFGEEVSFNYSDFEDLKHNKKYDRFEIGLLNVPTGEIVCTDPMYKELGLPQNWSVEPGKYPVCIYIALQGDFESRVAYAELTFSDAAITSWEMSLIPEQLLEDDFEKMMNGMYPVENGLSSFSDYVTWKNYCKKVEAFYEAHPDGNFYYDKLDSLFRANHDTPKSSRGEDWINYKINETENIIQFGSGWGDGLYPRYVGFDKHKKPVKFITDFIQLDKD